jgi:hypothetical protein
MFSSPVPGGLKRTAPHAAAGSARIIFGINVLERVLSIVEGPTLGNDAAGEVFAADVAHGDGAAVPIVPFRPTGDLTTLEKLGDPLFRNFAARPDLAVGRTGLFDFRGIDAVQAQAGSCNLDGIARTRAVPATSAETG